MWGSHRLPVLPQSMVVEFQERVSQSLGNHIPSLLLSPSGRGGHRACPESKGHAPTLPLMGGGRQGLEERVECERL